MTCGTDTKGSDRVVTDSSALHTRDQSFLGYHYWGSTTMSLPQKKQSSPQVSVSGQSSRGRPAEFHVVHHALDNRVTKHDFRQEKQ